MLAGRNNVGKTAFLQALTLPLAQSAGMADSFEMTTQWSITGDQLRSELQVAQWSVPGISEVLQEDAIYNIEIAIQAARPPGSLPKARAFGGPDSLLPGGLEICAIRIADETLVFERKQDPTIAPPRGTLDFSDEASGALRTISFLPARAMGLCSAIHDSIFYVSPRRTGASRTALTVVGDLATDGSNLTSVMAHLYNNRRHTTFPRLERFINDAFPEIQHVDVNLFQGKPPEAEIRIVYSSEQADAVPLALCGTGIEQLLMLGAAILASSGPRVFLIDEPHAFLHPHAERSLLRLMREHSEHQYIVATHSPVFLRTAQIRRVRLLNRTDRGTLVQAFDDAAQLLTELGVTADDLWSSDAILWVEGPTEVAAYEILGHAEPDLLAGILVKQMPDYMRAAPGKPTAIKHVEDIVRSVGDALSPLFVRTRFLFDRNDTEDARVSAVIDASGGRVEFLPCREVENLLLNARAILVVINRRRGELGLRALTEGEVSECFQRLLGEINDRDLYPPGVTAPDKERVRGSRLLKLLFSSFDNLEYEKVSDGGALVTEILLQEPNQLDPLRGPIARLRDTRH